MFVAEGESVRVTSLEGDRVPVTFNVKVPSVPDTV